jgi:hypothetical protein
MAADPKQGGGFRFDDDDGDDNERHTLFLLFMCQVNLTSRLCLN